jgi:hypothetical protein
MGLVGRRNGAMKRWGLEVGTAVRFGGEVYHLRFGVRHCGRTASNGQPLVELGSASPVALLDVFMCRNASISPGCGAYFGAPCIAAIFVPSPALTNGNCAPLSADIYDFVSYDSTLQASCLLCDLATAHARHGRVVSCLRNRATPLHGKSRRPSECEAIGRRNRNHVCLRRLCRNGRDPTAWRVGAVRAAARAAARGAARPASARSAHVGDRAGGGACAGRCARCDRGRRRRVRWSVRPG